MIGQLIEDGPRYFGKRDGWYWIVPCRGMPTKSCGANCSTNAMMRDVGIERLQRRARLIALERGELVHAHAALLGGTPERISPCARLLGRAEHPRDLRAAREERLEHCLSEILLADDGNAHFGVLS